MKSAQFTIHAAAVLTLCTLATGLVLADESGQTPSVKSTTGVSLTGLDLTTTAGMDAARQRLHQAARIACARVADTQDLGHQTAFVKCVDESTTAAMRQLDHSSQLALHTGPEAAPASVQAVGAPATSAKRVSIADLDLTTPAGAQAAHARVYAMARTVCTRVADMNDLSRQANFVKCVDDAMAGALPRLEELAKAGRSTGTVAQN